MRLERLTLSGFKSFQNHEVLLMRYQRHRWTQWM